MRCFKCHRFGHSKATCRRTAVCCRCSKGENAGKDYKAEPSCLNCNDPHAVDSKECPKWKDEENIQQYKVRHGGTFTQARAAVVVEPDPNLKRRTYAKATSVGAKTAQSAPPKGCAITCSAASPFGSSSPPPQWRLPIRGALPHSHPLPPISSPPLRVLNSNHRAATPTAAQSLSSENDSTGILISTSATAKEFLLKKKPLIPHLKYLKKKCQKAPNLIKTLCGTEWSKDETCVGAACHSSSADKCCGVSAEASIFTAEAVALCMALDTVFTSRKEKNVIFSDSLSLVKAKSGPSLRALLQNHLEKIETKYENKDNVKVRKPPPWEQYNVKFDTSLTEFEKGNTNALVLQKEFLNLKEQYNEYYEIYTDGSKQDHKVAAAFFLPDDPRDSVSARLRDHSSVFSAELEAILMGIKW
ncbi:hypothetical protein EGW08_019813 [Elysia chlorotica]|uniref:Uncharacterized protein n=1 Tax=Elysia chlorotica TaxID=188477 RepID=A0A3S1AUE4_ELYCH|nr:hypothetical protein EGW08_019813 [Elysia chlorotica]